MFRNIKDLFGFSILASDGEIGKVHDFLFSDDTWTIRYLVVDTGPWIFGRRVMIAVTALGEPDWNTKKIPVSLTREQVKNSPEIDMERPISRQQEIELHNHYRWSGYWTNQPGLTSEVNVPAGPYAPITPDTVFRDVDEGTPRLHSTRAVLSYEIQASGGEVGQVDEFIVDDDTWFIRYLVVDTGHWLPGKKILIAPLWVKSVRTEESEIFINIEREKIANSPEYDPNSPLAREYEELLYDHYDRTKYWRQSS